jgi:hypothetical protein
MTKQGTSSFGRQLPGVFRAWVAIVVFGLYATGAWGASISYGNFGPVPPGVTFTNVTESSGTDAVPLYGPPTPFVTGLDFDPLGFVATASGGGSDITDGQLNFGIQTNPFVGITTLNLFEAGDYTLVGSGTPATKDFAGAIIRITVTQIDGVNVAPISLTPANASVAFNLIANPGVTHPWSLGIGINVAAMLTSLGYQYQVGATGLEVVINNQLIALSEPSSLAFISKKDFRIDVGTQVPEPATCFLFGIGAVAGFLRLRNRRSVR